MFVTLHLVGSQATGQYPSASMATNVGARGLRLLDIAYITIRM